MTSGAETFSATHLALGRARAALGGYAPVHVQDSEYIAQRQTVRDE
jgi:hypothetical protein